MGAPPPEQLREVARAWYLLTDQALQQGLRQPVRDPIADLLPGHGDQCASAALVTSTEAVVGRCIIPVTPTGERLQVNLARVRAELKHWAARTMD